MKTITRENLAEIYEQLVNWFNDNLAMIHIVDEGYIVTSCEVILNEDNIELQPQNCHVSRDWFVLNDKIEITDKEIKVSCGGSGYEKGYYKE